MLALNRVRVKDDNRVHLRNPYANPDAGVTLCGVMYTVPGTHGMGRYGVPGSHTEAVPTCLRCLVQGAFP